MGAPVEFTYILRNKSDKALTYNFSSSKHFDLWIRLGDKEIFNLSKGMRYAMMMTKFTLKPGETKRFSAHWNQVDNDGKQVGPGSYDVEAQLTPSGQKPPSVEAKIQIGERGADTVAITIAEAIARQAELADKQVRISGTYRGFRPNPNDRNVKHGPPVTRSDWAISDSTGCMYVTGPSSMDPDKDVGRKVTVVGKLKKTAKGQVYLVLENAAGGRS